MLLLSIIRERLWSNRWDGVGPTGRRLPKFSFFQFLFSNISTFGSCTIESSFDCIEF